MKAKATFVKDGKWWVAWCDAYPGEVVYGTVGSGLGIVIADGETFSIQLRVDTSGASAITDDLIQVNLGGVVMMNLSEPSTPLQFIGIPLLGGTLVF